MRVFPVIFFATSLVIGSNRIAAEEVHPEFITLIAQLANLAVMADLCEKQLNNLGNKALQEGICKDFHKNFHELWPERNILKEEIAMYATMIEQGKMSCNESCQNMLLRSEELRITITYVLDYMEFAKEF